MDSYVAQDISVPTTAKASKRSARRRRQPYAWLGASALTFGVGVAMAGAGTAHADDAPSVDSARSAKVSASSAPASRGPARRGDLAVAGSVAGQRAAAPNSAAAVPSGGGRSAARVAQRTQGFAAPGGAAVASRDARTAVIRAALAIPVPGGPAAFGVSGARQAWEAFTSRPFNQFVEGLVLGRTAEIPKTTIVVQGKPITVGNAILANAFFDGYDGSPTGLAGLSAYVTAQLEASRRGDPTSGFTINNMTTPASYTAGGVTQQFRGMSGDTYEVAYYVADPKAYFKPAVGLTIDTAFGESTQLKANQWWPSSSEVPVEGGWNAHDQHYEYSGSATYTTTIAFNKAGFAPYGLESQIYNYVPAASGVAMSPDGQTLYVVSYSTNKLWAFNTADNTLKVPGKPDQSSWNLIGQRPTKIAVASDGYVYVAVGANEWGDTNYGHVEYLAPTGGSVRQISQALKDPQGITANAYGTDVYVANAGSDTLSIINSTLEADAGQVQVGHNPYGVVSNSGGGEYRNGLIYVSNYNYDNPDAGSVSIVSTVNDAGNYAPNVVGTINGLNRPTGLALTPNGRYLYVANEATGYVSQIDTTNNQVVSTIKVGNQPRSVAIKTGGGDNGSGGRDEYTVFVTNFGDNTISIINPAGTVTNTWWTGASGSDSIAVTPTTDAATNIIFTGNYYSGTVSVLGWADYGNNVTPAGDPAYVVSLQTVTTASADNYGNLQFLSKSTATCQTGSSGSDGGCSVFNTTPTDTVIDFVNEANTFITVNGTDSTWDAGATAAWGAVQGNILTNVLTVAQDSNGNDVVTGGSFSYRNPPPGAPGCVGNLSYCTGYSNPALLPGLENGKANDGPGAVNTYSWSTSTAVAVASSTVSGFTFNTKGGGTRVQKDLWSISGEAGVSYKNETTVSTTTTTTQSDQNIVQIPIGYAAFIYGAFPVVKYYGTWTATEKTGRTTYTLPDVWYATPGTGSPNVNTFGAKGGSPAYYSLASGTIPLQYNANNPAPADYGIPPDLNGGFYYDDLFANSNGIGVISALDYPESTVTFTP